MYFKSFTVNAEAKKFLCLIIFLRRRKIKDFWQIFMLINFMEDKSLRFKHLISNILRLCDLPF